ncbi:MAG: DUF2914 domain-containing protein [Methylobacter sp.]|jgi:hypothetical protein|nr:DUF2914 domain-containing protein [Methylobacter sp.]
MTDKRNIVIKVKYPVSGKATENLAPKMITEWNVKRIFLAAGALVLIVAMLFYVINNGAQETGSDNTAAIVSATENPATPQVDDKKTGIRSLDTSNQTGAKAGSSVKSEKKLNETNKQTAGITKKQPNTKVNKDTVYSDLNHNVSRASLTYKIDNKNPVGEVVRAVDVSHTKPVWVYYFTELKSMKGMRVYHEWLKNGVIVSRQALVISGDSWRTSSRKLLSVSEKGNWAVRLADEKGRLLNEKKFKVE